MLSADFFIPMRRLGSFFHVAMNGMAASDRLFRVLDLPEPEQKTAQLDKTNCAVTAKQLSFSYDKDREILQGIDLEFPMNKLTAVCGESGCGKSTIAGILTGVNKHYSGSVKIGSTELSELSEASLVENVTYISHNSYIFKGTVRDNLIIAAPDASDEQMKAALISTKLWSFLESEQGLDTPLCENAGNLSGGQRQRLALARAILHDSPIYIFDEATSSVDADSEEDIISMIYDLAGTKTVIMISHRLANVKNADSIYVLDGGKIAGHASHSELLKDSGGKYAQMWNTQQALENIGREGGIQ